MCARCPPAPRLDPLNIWWRGGAVVRSKPTPRCLRADRVGLPTRLTCDETPRFSSAESEEYRLWVPAHALLNSSDEHETTELSQTMKNYQSLFAASLFIALSASFGCGSTSNVVDDGKAVTDVEISPDKDGLTTGTKLQFTAMVKYADGTSKNVTSDSGTVWNTSDADVATVSTTGLVTAVNEGLVVITADYKGEKADEHFAVTP